MKGCNNYTGIFFAVLFCLDLAVAFQVRSAGWSQRPPQSDSFISTPPSVYYTNVLYASSAAESDETDVEAFLKERYPAFMAVLRRNELACKVLRESSNVGGFTVFCPNDQAVEALGEKKCFQLKDPRNSETTEKIGAYHVINEPITASALFNAGAVVTMGGQVPIVRSTSGGIFGMGGKEDGGVTVNGAKVLQSIPLGNGIIHEMDGFISPNLLWRYMDQLRFPGTS
jgi:uncharacterized surface protein with fasciclin (FAS1) repeats